MSTGQQDNLDAILRQSAFPAGIGVSELRRRLAELAAAQPPSAGVTVTAAARGGVPVAEITPDSTDPRHVIVYLHGGVYVLGDPAPATSKYQVKGPTAGNGRRASHHPVPAHTPGTVNDRSPT